MKNLTGFEKVLSAYLPNVIKCGLSLFMLSTAEKAVSQQDSSLFFVDATATHVPPAPGLHALDAAFADVDQDGDLDVIVAVEYGANRLYLNDGTGKLSWVKGAFGETAHDSEHVLTADFNKDGFIDVVFVAEDDHFHQLFLGESGGTFKEVSDRLPQKSEGNAVAIGDVNADGLPDIVIGNSAELKPGQTKRMSGQDFLWLNDPKRPGFFIDVTISHMPKDDDDTQGIGLADLDGDGDVDLVMASETQPSRLLLNNGKGYFTDESKRLELLVPLETREVHVFDANGDNKPDLLFLNLTSNNHGWVKDPQARLLINDGTAHFKDSSIDHLPKNRFSSWGGAILDFNDDGHPDILVSAIEVPGFVPLQMRGWVNNGKGYFTDETKDIIPGVTVGRSWSMAVGDLNGDGRNDVFIGAWGTQARLLLGRKAISTDQKQ